MSAVEINVTGPDAEDLSPSERLGLAVALAHGEVVGERDRARATAMSLAEELAECHKHLAKVLEIVRDHGWSSSWAYATGALEAAALFSVECAEV